MVSLLIFVLTFEQILGRKEKTMIHQYKNNGYNIVMDVNSGSIHVVRKVFQ